MIIIRRDQCAKVLLCRLTVENGTGAAGGEVFRVRVCSRLACVSFTVRAPVYYATPSQRSSSVVLLFLHFDDFFFFGAGRGNKQKRKAKFKDAPPSGLLISVQSSPGPLLPADEWRRWVGGGAGGRWGEGVTEESKGGGRSSDSGSGEAEELRRLSPVGRGGMR